MSRTLASLSRHPLTTLPERHRHKGNKKAAEPVWLHSFNAFRGKEQKGGNSHVCPLAMQTRRGLRFGCASFTHSVFSATKQLWGDFLLTPIVMASRHQHTFRQHAAVVWLLSQASAVSVWLSDVPVWVSVMRLYLCSRVPLFGLCPLQPHCLLGHSLRHRSLPASPRLLARWYCM